LEWRPQRRIMHHRAFCCAQRGHLAKGAKQRRRSMKRT
jgi:hypothetical protein